VLRELHISGLGVIDDLDLQLHPGLNVLTGETGAGKTMVAVGLSLALGGRAASSFVREGAIAARVQVRFDAPAGSDEWSEEGELLLARTVSVEGGSSARVGGQLATASTLATLGGELVEIHGQNQTQRLLSSAVQTSFLDRFAGDTHRRAVEGYAVVFRRLGEARSAVEELREASRTRERELDLLGYQVREIQTVAPRAGETDDLVGEEARLAQVERLIEGSRAAAEALGGDGGDGGAADALAWVARSLDDAASVDRGAQELASRARSVAAESVELARDVRAYAETLVPDPDRLQTVRERVAALRGLQRKYGASDAKVLEFLLGASSRLASLEVADERLGELEAEVARLESDARSRAGAIGEARHRAAPRLARALETELGDLGMPGARMQVSLEALPDLGPAGAERVELLFSSGPAGALTSLTKAASGGEISRAMLACRSVLADLDDIPTLVFDEVDVGIGGEVGLAVGRRLARLADDRQVVVVTHLPQIACFAARHIRIEKLNQTASVTVLEGEARVHELSRMLAGLTGSETAVSHANELLAEARRLVGAPAG
jgi:DNA repair protein RecN (Recombination protein N)